MEPVANNMETDLNEIPEAQENSEINIDNHDESSSGEEDNDVQKITDWFEKLEKKKLAEQKEKEKPRNFLLENQLIREAAQKKAAASIAERKRVSNELYERILAEGGNKYQNVHKHMYSTQKLNFKRFQVEYMRCQLCGDSNNGDLCLTYNKDMLSMSIPSTLPSDRFISLVDPPIREDVNLKHSKDTFQYPKHRTSEELRRHPLRPSDTRIDDLKQPWNDPMIRNHHKGLGLETSNEQLYQRERTFHLRNRADDTFGHLNRPRFEKSFDRSALATRHQLPRGKLITGGNGDKNNQFFRSIHLVGDEQARAAEMAQWQEREDWRRKVVVDNASFKVGGFHVRDRPSQLSKYEDILQDEPKSKALQTLRMRKSHKEKDFGHATTPATLLSKEPFID